MAPRINRLISTLSLPVIAAACANSSQTITGMPRPSISADNVRVYTHAPPSFEEIAVLSASRRSFSGGGERAIAKMIENLKQHAATLGANGLLLEDLSEAQAVSVGTGVESQTYTHNGSMSLGVETSVGVVEKTAKGRAIFVPAS
jgi:hypothetical protein